MNYKVGHRFYAGFAAILIFTISGLVVAQIERAALIAKLTASDAAQDDFFGKSIDIDGNTLIVGAPSKDFDTNGLAGAVYIYVQQGGTWVQQAKLLSHDPSTALLGGFGEAVALDGNQAIISAPFGPAGGTYIFQRNNAGVWSMQQRINDIVFGELPAGGVDIDGTTAVIGAPRYDTFRGAAYVYTRSGSTWTQQIRLVASDAAERDGFGNSVAISGNTIMVGLADDLDAAGTGAVYVYERSGNTWVEQAKLMAADAQEGARFGQSVKLNGDTAVIGATGKGGAVYVFERISGVWTQTAKLVPNNLLAGQYIGEGVDFDSNRIVAGRINGTAYIFVKSNGTWLQTLELTDGDTTDNNRFGAVSAIAGTTVVVGASLDDAAAENGGAAHVFNVPDTPSELLVNGGFEIPGASNKEAANWKSAEAKRVVNKPDKNKIVAHGGEAAFQFKGVDGVKSKLSQSVTSPLLVGNTLTLSAWVEGKSFDGGKISAKITHDDGTKTKLSIENTDLNGSYTYNQVITGVTLTKSGNEVKVQVQVKNGDGKLYVDDISLVRVTIPPSALQPLPLP
jgi:hypothetical protein